MARKAEKKRKKKPYEKPAIQTESVIESATLACGKCLPGGPVGSQMDACKQATRTS